MPTTCAFNSDPIATPAANKVTLTGGRKAGQTAGQTGRSYSPCALAPRLLGADTFPVTRELFYCQTSKCTPNRSPPMYSQPRQLPLLRPGVGSAPACGIGSLKGGWSSPPIHDQRWWVGGSTVPVGMADPLHHICDQRYWADLALPPGFVSLGGGSIP